MLRTIVESGDVTKALDALRKAHARFDDWWECGWSWRLARDPFRDAVKIPGTNPSVYLLKTSANHAEWGFPFTLTFMYIVSDSEINLLNVRVAEIKVADLD